MSNLTIRKDIRQSAISNIDKIRDYQKESSSTGRIMYLCWLFWIY